MGRGVEILVAAFKDEAGADAAYKQLKSSANSVWVDNVAVVVNDGKKVTFKESRDMGGGKGAVIGGAIGALTTLLFPPAMLITTAAGAIIGGITAKLHDSNLPSETLRKVGEQLTPGTGAIIALVDETLLAQATDALTRLGATVSTVGLDSETIDRLNATGDAGEPGAGA